MPKATDTVLEVSLASLAHNYSVLRSRLNPGTKFLGVVKAAAYGSEAVAIARELEKLGADYLAVAYVHEGVALREAGISLPILVFHPQPANFAKAIAHCLEPSLYSANVLRSFQQTAESLDQDRYPVHLKFNTGLNRLGFWENDIEFIAGALKGNKTLKIASVFSHLAASEDIGEKEFTLKQIAQFNKILQQFEHAFGFLPIRHILNTSGIFNFPDSQLDMVRSGIGLYGYGNDPRFDEELRAVSTLKTIISQLHKIEPGESVGYNRGFTSDGYRITATLPIGHADGIGRHYGNGKARVWIHNKAAPVIGNVCMDMMMVDVTDIPCKEGDEVVVFGPDCSADELASSANTISYELLTGISPRIKRLIHNE